MILAFFAVIIKTMGIKKYMQAAALSFLALSAAAQNLTGNNRNSGGAFAWRKALDVEKGASKEELFDGYLGDLVYVTQSGYKALPPDAAKEGLNLESKASYYLKQGELLPTPNMTDFAVAGQGFFKVSDEQGNIYFTRNGAFKADAAGLLRDSSNRLLLPQAQISSADRNLFADVNSALYRVKSGESQPEKIYQFVLFLPAEDAVVERVGGDFTFSAEKEAPLNAANRVYNKTLEMSTVEGAKTLVQMTDILFNMQAEESNTYNLSSRFYLLDFLLKEFAKADGDGAALERFSRLAEGVAPSLSFQNQSVKE